MRNCAVCIHIPISTWIFVLFYAVEIRNIWFTSLKFRFWDRCFKLKSWFIAAGTFAFNRQTHLRSHWFMELPRRVQWYACNKVYTARCSSNAEVTNMRPAGRMRPAKHSREISSLEFLLTRLQFLQCDIKSWYPDFFTLISRRNNTNAVQLFHLIQYSALHPLLCIII